MNDPDAALRAITMIASVGVCISGLELLSEAKLFRTGGLMSWEVSKLRHRGLQRAIPALRPIFSTPGISTLISISVLSASLLLIGSLPSCQGLFAGLIALTYITLAIRSPYGLDGADQLTILTFSAIALASLSSGALAKEACLWFLTGQVCLAYFTSGAAKLSSADWRNGRALAGIMNTRIYGCSAIGSFLRQHPSSAAVISGGIIAMECAFELVLLLPEHLALVLVAAGFGFHLLAAMTMRLNTFFWSFVAIYPAILHCAAQLHQR